MSKTGAVWLAAQHYSVVRLLHTIESVFLLPLMSGAGRSRVLSELSFLFWAVLVGALKQARQARQARQQAAALQSFLLFLLAS